MTPHRKSNSDGCGNKVSPKSSQQAKQAVERQRTSSSDANIPSVNQATTCGNSSTNDLYHAAFARSTSDATSNKLIHESQPRRQSLQTISSGVALDKMNFMTQSLPPLSPTKAYHHSPLMLPRKAVSYASPPQHYQQQQLSPSIPTIDSSSENDSHSSIDTSLKQGTFMQQLRANSHRGGDGNDSDSAVDSLVFHRPEVYAVHCNGEGMHMAPQPSSDQMLAMSSLTDSAGPEIRRFSSPLLDDDNGVINTWESVVSQPIIHENRYELLPPQSECQDHNEVDPQTLPYNERKRLVQIKEKEEKKNSKKESKLAAKTRLNTRLNKSEKVPLINTKYLHKPEILNQLTSLIRGKQSEHNQHHKRYGSIEDESKEYIDKGKAFLQQTKKERTKMQAQFKSDELRNVTVPVSTLHSS